jgi:hypothetical protein
MNYALKEITLFSPATMTAFRELASAVCALARRVCVLEESSATLSPPTDASSETEEYCNPAVPTDSESDDDESETVASRLLTLELTQNTEWQERMEGRQRELVLLARVAALERAATLREVQMAARLASMEEALVNLQCLVAGR